jgi:hypothetical protein
MRQRFGGVSEEAQDAIRSLRAAVLHAVEDTKDQLKLWIQRQTHIAPVYKTIIGEAIGAFPNLLDGTVEEAAALLMKIPVIYPRVTYRVTLGEWDQTWSSEIALSVPMGVILTGDAWDVGPRDDQWARADGTSGRQVSFERSDDDESDDERDEGRTFVVAIHPGAVGDGTLFAWLSSKGIQLDEQVLRGVAGGRKRKWTELEWGLYQKANPAHAVEMEDENPDQRDFETVDLADPQRSLPSALRGAHERHIVSTWEELMERPEVAAQLAVVTLHRDNSGVFAAELEGWTHPLVGAAPSAFGQHPARKKMGGHGNKHVSGAAMTELGAKRPLIHWHRRQHAHALDRRTGRESERRHRIV